MKKTIALLLVLALVAPSFAAVTTTATQGATASVKTLKTTGEAGSKLGAAEAMTIAPTKEAVKGTASVEAKIELKFKDLAKKDFAYPYVLKMVMDYHIVSGYPDNTFRGKKAVTRAEFCKIMAGALSYLETKEAVKLAENPATTEVSFKDLKKKDWSYPYIAGLVSQYKIFSGYPDKTFKPNKTINRYEIATVASKALKMVYKASGTPLPETGSLESVPQFKDIKANHWAMNDIKLLVSSNIMQGVAVKEKPAKKQKGKKAAAAKSAPQPAVSMYFYGSRPLTRSECAIVIVRLIEKAGKMLAKASEQAAVSTLGPQTPTDKYMAVGNPKAYISGSYGNINESASTTNNWMGLGGSALYGNSFNIFNIKGDYELTGKYGYNQLIYYVPSGLGGGLGGGVGIAGGAVNENRLDIDANTVYPIINFYGFEGKLLLGLKYASLSNTLAATNFSALNAGIATVFPVMGQKFLGRAFYSLMPSTAAKNASVLGQPTSLLNYEAGTDVEIMKTPMTIGYNGETMFINGAYSRYYNMIFVRYNLL